MSGENRETRSDLPVRHRNARVGWNRKGRADARNDLERYVSRSQAFSLLATSAKNEWITAFKANDESSLVATVNQKIIQLCLTEGMARCFFAGVNQLRVRPSPAQHFRIAEMIVNDDISLLDSFFCSQG